MKNHPARRHIPRPLLIASAVGLVCQTAYAQTVEELSQTPFAKRPLHLQNTSETTSAHGVKPNVMFFVDDSGSMQALVGGQTERNNPEDNALRTSNSAAWNSLVNSNYANPVPCTFSAAALGTDNNCYRLWWPHNGFFRLRQQNNRIRVTMDALNAVVDKYGDDWRWNLYTLWGSEVRASRNGEPAWDSQAHPFMDAAAMKNLIRGLSPTSNTPTTERYVRLARIMKDSIEYRCQKSYIVLMSDGDANNAGLPNFQDWERELYGRFTNRTNPNRWGGGVWETWTRTYNGATAQYQPYRAGADNGVSLFSQILAEADLKGETDRVGSGPEGRDKEGGYWNENTDDPDPRYRNTNFTKQSIQTFVVGFGAGLSANGRNYLRDAATCEGTREGRCFFMPNTGEELAEAFNVIAESIENDNEAGAQQTFSASTPSATGSTIADLAATLTLDTGKWSSQLLFAKFANGKLTNDTEHAGYENRRVLVNNGNSIYWLDSTTPATRKTDFGIRDDNEFTRAFVPWLTRSASLTDAQIVAAAETVPEADRTVKKYRERAATAHDAARQMADVIGAPVVAMGKISATDNKQKYIVTAANDGMAYIFSATGGGSPQYNLALNYLPAGMQRQGALAFSNPAAQTVGRTIRVTAESDYGSSDETHPHVFLNNGGLSWVRTPKTGGRNQQDVLLGTMGQGGRGAYALTIAGKKRASTHPDTPAGLDTNPNQWLTEVPLWETDKSASNALGYTISTAAIGQVARDLRADGYPKVDQGIRVYAFISNGYETGEAGVPYDSSPTLYVYDMMGQEFGRSITTTSSVENGHAPGHLVTKISVGGSERGALSSPTLLDSNLDGITDFAYAGDNKGNLYRFDLRGDPATWSARKIYDGSATQPITAAPAIHKIDSNNFVIVFGTGSDIYDADRQNIDQQMVAGIYDDVSNASPQAADINDLLQQTISISTVNAPGQPEHGKRFRHLSKNEFRPGVHKGWYVNLDLGTKVGDEVTKTSERVVVKPQVLLRTVFLTTRIYNFEKTHTTLPPQAVADNTCFATGTETKTAGNSWQMGIDARTGSGPLAGTNSSDASGAYFTFSDNSASTSTDSSNNRTVAAGFEYGYLASATGLLSSGDGAGGGSGGGAGGSSIIGNWQTNAHGELSNSGEIVSAFDTSGGGGGSGELGRPVCVDPVTGERNPLCEIRTDCIPRNVNYSLLVATGGADADRNHNVFNIELSGPTCPDPLSKGNTLIRVDWREVPL